ncbi:MAG: hypothetical protein LBD50_00805 [Rickettsiales bacterium]|jgi:hypothetical protein|nr:hypothetical protein [Rickettsiales bacterium]
MVLKKNYIIIGLTTFNTEFLRISIPAISKLKQKIYLIAHNDNPNARVVKSQIRRLGYRGPLHIINSAVNGGPMRARLNILSAIEKLNIKSDWMIFVDDDDLLIDIDVPAVKPGNFAIMQNMAFIKRRLLDLLRVMDNPKNYAVDEANITAERPHIGIVGTLLRTGLMVRLGAQVQKIMPQIMRIDAELGWRAPEDVVMWFYLQIYAKRQDPAAGAIYMDKINYIATSLDSSPQKYGLNQIPRDQPQECYDRIMQKYCDLFEELLNSEAAGE